MHISAHECLHALAYTCHLRAHLSSACTYTKTHTYTLSAYPFIDPHNYI